MDILYEKYVNIQKFIIEYRKYVMVDSFYTFELFKKNMDAEHYILHKCTDTKKGRIIYIYLFKETSRYLKNTPYFKRLIDKLPNTPADVIIISKHALNTYIIKAISTYNYLHVHNYMQHYFAIELSKGPLCSKHTILTTAEVKHLCSNELIIHPLSLPSISVNDPQNIWIGGELGQVVKIESLSEITGRAIRYRIISPDSGKIINIHRLSKTEQDEADDKKNANNISDDTSDPNLKLKGSAKQTPETLATEQDAKNNDVDNDTVDNDYDSDVEKNNNSDDDTDSADDTE